MRRNIEFDGTRIQSEADLHTELKVLFNLPREYNNDISHLEEFMQIYLAPNVTLYWTNHHISRQNLGYTFDRVISVFSDFKFSYPEFEYYLN